MALKSFPGVIHQPIDGVGERESMNLGLFVAGDKEHVVQMDVEGRRGHEGTRGRGDELQSMQEDPSD